MNRVRKPYLDRFVIVFIEDIFIYSSGNKECEEHFRLIMGLRKNNGFYTKFSKCEFWLLKVQFLGHVVDSQGIHVDTAKLKKSSVAADALSRNERAKPLKVRALVMTINSNLPSQIHKAQVESLKTEKVKEENLHANEPLAIPLDEIQVDDKLHFIEEPVEIMDREVKRLKQSRIPIVKVCWNSRRGPEFTWEREDQMQKKYPHLFTNSAPAAEVAS
ncbi:hypothetical protein Tco_0883038 [Tanacetum coccineum]